MIFSSDMRACFSLLRAVAVGESQCEQQGKEERVWHQLALGWAKGENSHLSILTATFMVDREWLRPWAVASTTRPKAPEPRVRPARNSQEAKLATF